MYLMPRAPDGEIAVRICLQDENMNNIEGNYRNRRGITLNIE